mgnify:CR=1 FL=1
MKEFSAVRNTIYSGANVAISPILMIGVTPVLLSSLGSEQYAIWILVNSFIASLAIFNFGASDVIVKYVSLYNSRGEERKVYEVLSTISGLQGMSFLGLYGVLCGLRFFFPEKLNSYMDLANVSFALFFFRQFEQILYAFLKGLERFGLVSLFSITSKALFFSTQAVVALKTNNVTYVIASACCASALGLAVEAYILKIVIPRVLFIRAFSVRCAKEFFHFGSWNWLGSAASMLGAHSDKWIVTGLWGLKAFAPYSLGILVFNQLHTVLAASVSWIFPSISIAGDSPKVLAKKYHNSTITVCISSYVISGLLCSFSGIFSLWLGKEMYQESALYINLFLAALPVFAMSIVPYYFLLGLGLVREKFIIDLMALFLKIVLVTFSVATLESQFLPPMFLVFISAQCFFYLRRVSWEVGVNPAPLMFLLAFNVAVSLVRMGLYVY